MCTPFKEQFPVGGLLELTCWTEPRSRKIVKIIGYKFGKRGALKIVLQANSGTFEKYYSSFVKTRTKVLA